jgi:hypothetical protein
MGPKSYAMEGHSTGVDCNPDKLLNHPGVRTLSSARYVHHEFFLFNFVFFYLNLSDCIRKWISYFIKTVAKLRTGYF